MPVENGDGAGMLPVGGGRTLEYDIVFSMKFRSLSEAKIELGTLVRLAEQGETIVISRHGKPAVRLTPVAEEDFQLSAAEASKLNAWADAERRGGRTRTYDSVADLLRRTRRTKKKTRA